mmetsp:Transcript_5553/g.8405  ORF Transcript_5553/g.8405 Transcript_5553/m.8405 type:complete len:254 (+) Transcript_5553:335-1096(+)
MSSANQIEILSLQKRSHDIRPISIRHSTIILPPPSHLLIRVRPKKITEKPSVRDVCGSNNSTNLLHCLQIRGKTPMHAKNLLINNCGNGEAIKTISERLPKLNIVPPLTLVVKPINTIDGGTLMVPPQNEEVVRIFDFVRQQKTDGFETVLPSVHIISEEKVVGIRREVAILKETEEVIILTMDIPANFDRSLQLQQDRLADKDFSGLHTQPTNLDLLKGDIPPRTAAPHLQKPVDDRIDINVHVLFLLCWPW